MEAPAVLGRRHLELAQEGPAHRLGCAEPAGCGDGCDGLGAVLESPPRGLEAHPLDVAAGRDPGLGAKGAREVARAHVGARGHRLDGVILRDMLNDESHGLAQRLALGLLGGERRAELRLVSGTAQKQDEVTCDRERRVAVQVLLHERERQVHAGRHPGRRPDRAIANEDRLRVDVDGGMQAGELAGGRPVGRRAATVEESRSREQEGAGAYGDRPPGCGRHV
ncbi:MAG: cyclohexyl-isocyanide hydratase [Solirubrobacteraceae bacterium]|nr:cyclohexyl-isocyanide hydratase [Solirubrobacteraceae bacterium]